MALKQRHNEPVKQQQRRKEGLKLRQRQKPLVK